MAEPKRALITGITGQDGSYLAELLLDKGYEVHGIVRRSSSFNTGRIDHLYRDPHEQDVRLFNHYGDLTDPVALTKLLYELQPAEIYHLGAQSHVRVSFDLPVMTFDVTGGGTMRLLEAVRESGVETRICHASSSEIFGTAPPPQAEETPIHPRSPYAVAKAAAHWAGVNYREAYGAFIANAIMFNHESPRRGETFVTRKITRAVARIGAGLEQKLYLGNLEAKRDWGYAPEYVKAMWRMLQADEPLDLVIATGEQHSVREFAEAAFEHAGLDPAGRIEIDPRYYRPAEVDDLLGDASRAREAIGWRPQVTFGELVRIMVDADTEALERRMAGQLGALRARGPRVTARPQPDFWRDRAVAVTGGGGFLGRPTVGLLEELGAKPRAVRSAEHDLRDPRACRKALEGADVVIHLAANVGGIGYNRRNPGPLARDNLLMGVNVFDACRDLGVAKLVTACSVCAYPGETAVPFREEAIFDGFPDESNAPYGLAKRMLITLADAYRRQHGLESCVPVIPNLYGPGDNFDLEDSHVVAALIRRYCEAAERRSPSVTVWGSGEATREFLYVDDAARALVLAAERCETAEPFNVGTGVETPIRELAETIASLAGFEGETLWDSSRPDGQRRRFLEVSRARDWIGFEAEVPLRRGLEQTLESFRSAPVGA